MDCFIDSRVSYAFSDGRRFWATARKLLLSLYELNSLYEFVNEQSGSTYFHFENFMPDGYLSARRNCLLYGNELVAFLEIVPTPLNEDMVCWSRGSAELIKNSECILRVHIEKMMRRYNTTYEFYQGFNPPFECVSHMSPSEAWAFHIDLDLNRLRMKLAVFMTIITLIFND